MSSTSLEMKRALLIFAKQPVPGRVKTRLSPPLSPDEAAELYHCMLADTMGNHLSCDHFDTLVFFEPSGAAEAFFRRTWPGVPAFPQQGEGLGERLEQAFALAFVMGFGAVAAIGSDSPDLPPLYVEDAFRLLEEGRADVIFGPVEDGGYCLIAMKRPYPGLFRDIPWSSGEVLERSEEAARALGLRSARLPLWHDLDRFEDLELLLTDGSEGGAARTAGFLRRLRELHVI